MAKLPRDISGRQMVAVLKRKGSYVLHQRGGHIVMRRDEPKTTISIPDHREFRAGTLRVILHQAGLDVEELANFL